MPNHPTGNNESLRDLAVEVANLRYDSLQFFIRHLTNDLERQAARDYSKGRVQLCEELILLTGKLREASAQIGKVWKVCEPHMKESESVCELPAGS